LTLTTFGRQLGESHYHGKHTSNGHPMHRAGTFARVVIIGASQTSFSGTACICGFQAAGMNSKIKAKDYESQEGKSEG
jgi:hypothetical protein